MTVIDDVFVAVIEEGLVEEEEAVVMTKKSIGEAPRPSLATALPPLSSPPLPLPLILSSSSPSSSSSAVGNSKEEGVSGGQGGR